MSIDPAKFASISALIRGVEAHLRSPDLFNDLPSQAVGRYFGRQPAPGKPPPKMGQWFVSIYWGGGRGNDFDPQRHDVFQGVALTLTARLSYAPPDRQGIRLTSPGDMYDLADALAGPGVIHGSFDLLTTVNRLLPGTREQLEFAGLDPDDATVNGFAEPLVFESLSQERPVSKDWIGSATDASDVYAIDIRFGRARRIQGQY